MKIRGFISYTHSDERHADRLAEKLRVLGVEIWRDRYQMVAGSEIAETIGRAIENTIDVVFVIVSAKALFAPWVKWESLRAANAAVKGHHLKVVYIVVEEFALPDEIRSHVYIDFSVPRGKTTVARVQNELKATEDLARYLLAVRPLARLGIYDIYSSYSDLDQRRESADGTPGANVYTFMKSANRRLTAMGFFFGHLFGMEGGTALALWIRSRAATPDAGVELFVPDPDHAPLDNLREIYPHGEQIPDRIRDFIRSFVDWGKKMRLTEPESRIVTLQLLRCCPTSSFLALDPDDASGRIIVSFSPTGYGSHGSDYLFHAELRHPQTPIYSHFLDTIEFARNPKMQTTTIKTSHG